MGVTPLFLSLKNSGLTLRPFLCFFLFLVPVVYIFTFCSSSCFYLFLCLSSSVFLLFLLSSVLFRIKGPSAQDLALQGAVGPRFMNSKGSGA